MNKMYGFEGEIKAKYNMKMAEFFSEIFNYLPLCHVINRKVTDFLILLLITLFRSLLVTEACFQKMALNLKTSKEFTECVSLQKVKKFKHCE